MGMGSLFRQMIRRWSTPYTGRQYRQGDLLFVSQFQMPAAAAVRRPANVIERGKLTRHAHRLLDGAVYDHAGRTYVEAGPTARVLHEEHETLELPEGFYRIIQQREYRGEEEWTNVRD